MPYARIPAARSCEESVPPVSMVGIVVAAGNRSAWIFSMARNRSESMGIGSDTGRRAPKRTTSIVESSTTRSISALSQSVSS